MMTTICFFGWLLTTCHVIPPPSPEQVEAQRQYTEQMIAEQDARIAKWEAFCKPRIVQDKDGISRYVYKHAGCDTGRSE